MAIGCRKTFGKSQRDWFSIILVDVLLGGIWYTVRPCRCGPNVRNMYIATGCPDGE